MTTLDRYLKIILTIIAAELLWIGVRPPAVQAQGPTPVVIAGVQMPGTGDLLPVRVGGVVLVENVPYTPSLTPGD